MRYYYLAVFCFSVVGCSTGASPAAVQKDSAGKTPAEYAKAYYDAINRDDLAAIRAMYTDGYYESIVTKSGFLNEPDESLFAAHMERHMHKTTSIKETKSGFLRPPMPKGCIRFWPRLNLLTSTGPYSKSAPVSIRRT